MVEWSCIYCRNVLGRDKIIKNNMLTMCQNLSVFWRICVDKDGNRENEAMDTVGLI